MGEGIIDEGGPEKNEDAPCGKLDPLGHRTGDECHGDHGEHALEHGEDIFGDGTGLGRHVLEQGIDRVAILEGDEPVEHRLGKVADQAADRIGSEGQRVADDGPLDTDDPHGHKGVHEGGEDVLGADHTAVEERQAGQHKEDHGTGDENPGGVARIQDRIDVFRLGRLGRGCNGCRCIGSGNGNGRGSSRC